MKEIGVVANHKTINYGTMLQAYATQIALTQLGYKVETINIDGIANDIRNKKLRYFIGELSKRELFEAKYPGVRKDICKRFNKDFARNITIREEKFCKFRESNFPMSEYCTNRAALTQLARSYDAVLIGSDQVWLPSNIAADVTTLSFVPDEINKVAFSSSFGVPELHGYIQEKAKVFLARINHISVREESGKKLIKRLTGRDVLVVCDPSLLFSATQWENMIPSKQVFDEPYIFCYFLGNNPEQRRFVKEFSKILSLNIISIPHMDEYIKSDNDFPDFALYDIGPEEFLNLLRNAKFVFTDSFHGTALSVLHHKEFFTFYRFKKDAVLSTNTRIDSFFNVIGLKERLITTSVNVESCMKTTSDFNSALVNIEQLRSKSWGYLDDALKGKQT